MRKRRVTVFLTGHFVERYQERIGNASPAAQRAWIANTIRKRSLKRLEDGKYHVRLRGSSRAVVLAREYDGMFVAVTVK
jgi:hypothetical protein